MKINYGQTINTLSGTPYQSAGKDLTLGSIVAEALAVDPSGGKMKLYALAQSAYRGGEQEVDSADLKLIKTAVENCKSYDGNAILLGQALERLEKVS